MGNNTYFWDENVNPLLYRYPGTAGRARAEPQDLQIVERTPTSESTEPAVPSFGSLPRCCASLSLKSAVVATTYQLSLWSWLEYGAGPKPGDPV